MVAPQPEDTLRRIHFDGTSPISSVPSLFVSNYIRTTKYTLLSFLPKNLFEQFRKKANFYFLIIAVLSLMPFSPKRPEVSILPLVFVLFVSAVKEAFEDFSRYQMDRDLNNSKVLRWDGKAWADITWQEVAVGDLLKIFENMAFPADILLLQSSGVQGMCTIETSNLDGETNLKIKKAIGPSCSISSNETASDFPFKINGIEIESSLPNPRMDKNAWEGTICGVSNEKESLGMNQLLLRGCTLRNTKWIVGIVMFTGIETKLMLNNKIVLFKRSSVERTVDRALYVVFGAQLFFCLFGLIANWVWLSINAKSHTYLEYPNGMSSVGENILAVFTYLILLDSLVPISLYVSMELVKFTQAWLVNQDLRMYHEETDTPAKARTSNLNEELGQVQYLFSDKTGTLTQNKMEFLRCCVGGIKYGPGEMQAQDESKPLVPMERGLPDAISAFRFQDNRPLWHIDEMAPNASKMNDFLELLAVCHTVICEAPRPNSAVVEYQASSPDELALVIAAHNLHFYFFERQAANITIEDESIDGQICIVNIRGEIIHFEILSLLEFNSTRKRMSVVVRNRQTGVIKVFCKGADNVILERLTAQSKQNDWPVAESYLREYAKDGLRTLCCAGKTLSQAEFLSWYLSLKEARNSMENRDFKVGQCGEMLELDLDLIGCTAIEDRLQDGVPDCIASLAEADIKIWVLTGDKVETAINIGRAARLLTEKMKGEKNLIVIDISEHLDDQEAQEQTVKEVDAAVQISQEHPDGSDNLGLVISGKALSFMFPARKRTTKGREIPPTPAELVQEKSLQIRLLKLCKKCKAVVCCRVSPIQKAQIVLLVKENEVGKVTLAIGDGANDVPMIRAAHVGIGISGQEGLQAVMSSDYAIAQFRFLKQLLLVHGAWSYRRISLLINYSFYKNMTISFLQLLFAFYNGFSGQLFFDAFTGSLYNMIFTAFPVLLVAIFNRDVAARSSRRFPSLYTSGQQNSKFNIPLLLLWLLKGILHAFILFFIAQFSIMHEPASGDGKPQDVWVSSSSVYLACLVVVTIEIGLQTTTWVSWSITLTALSVLMFFIWILVYSTPLTVTPDMLGVGLSTPRMWFYLALAVFICIIPNLLISYVFNELFPDRWRLVAELERESGILDKAIAAWASPRAPIAKQGSVLQITELKDVQRDPANGMKKRGSEHLGFAPFQEDERDPDFIMGQEEYLHRSLCEDLPAANVAEPDVNGSFASKVQLEPAHPAVPNP